MGLRLAEGVPIADLARRLGLGQSELVDEAKLARYADLGLAWREGAPGSRRIGATPQGMLLLNSLIAELVPQNLVEQAG